MSLGGRGEKIRFSVKACPLPAEVRVVQSLTRAHHAHHIPHSSERSRKREGLRPSQEPGVRFP